MQRQFYKLKQAEDEPCEAFLKWSLDLLSNIELAWVDGIHCPYLLEELKRTKITKDSPMKTIEVIMIEAKTNTVESFRRVISGSNNSPGSQMFLTIMGRSQTRNVEGTGQFSQNSNEGK